MHIYSTRFGELDVSEQDIFYFSQGVLGFPDEKKFVLLPYQPNSPFAFLQSITEPNLTFLIVEPFSFFKEYTFELDDEIVKELGLSADNPPQIFNIVTLSGNIGEMTANLLAPIIINQRNRTAIQIIHEKTSYTTRHLIFPDGLPKQDSKGGE